MGIGKGVLLALLFISFAHSRVLYATEDVTIYGGISDESNGAGDNIVGVQNGNDGRVFRSLLKFDFTTLSFLSTTNQQGTLLSASMVITIVKRSGGPADANFEVFPVTTQWNSGSSEGSAAEGDTAQTGDVTWIYNVYDTSSWINPGGDYDAAAIGSGNVPAGASEDSIYRVDLTPSKIQEWIDDPSSHLGVLIKCTDEVTAGSAFRMYDANAASPVYIEIEYSTTVTTDVLVDVTLYGTSAAVENEANAVGTNIVGKQGSSGNRVWRTLMKFNFSPLNSLSSSSGATLLAATLKLPIALDRK